MVPTEPADLLALASVAQRVDGLPLAIELAAARLAYLTPTALLDRLEHRLPLLTSRNRDIPGRQRTMRDTIAWSYGLLTPAEQGLFRRLGVFAGGFSIEAAVAVQGAFDTAAGDAFDLVADLVDRSIVQRRQDVQGQPRFGLLETIREFALDELQSAGERAAAERAHAGHLLALAERASEEMRGAEQASWIPRLDAESGNLRNSLQWTIDHAETEIALRLTVGLSTYWAIHSSQREGLDWISRSLALPADPLLDDLRGSALRCGAALAWAVGDFALATGFGEQSLAIARAAGNHTKIAGALINLGVIAGRLENHPKATALFEEGLAEARVASDPFLIGAALANLGLEATEGGDHAAAVRHFEEGLRLFREMGNDQRTSQMLANLALASHRTGELDRARTLYDEALQIQRRLGDDRSAAITLEACPVCSARLARKTALPPISLKARCSIRVGNPAMGVSALFRLAELEAARGHSDRAAWLLGAADALREGAEEPPWAMSRHLRRARPTSPAPEAATFAIRSRGLARAGSPASRSRRSDRRSGRKWPGASGTSFLPHRWRVLPRRKPDRARDAGAPPARRRKNRSRHRSGALREHEDRVESRRKHPGQARRRDPHRRRRSGDPAGSRLGSTLRSHCAVGNPP